MLRWIKRLLKIGLPTREREWMIWVGDGMAPAGLYLVGQNVNYLGRRGKVIDATLLSILVEWES
ncbi:MAG: hypothetical protein L0312_20065 [Acidobacteria bacterium]|nr:hypothetical protein [Acidobacteriota bacterium]